MTRQRRVRLTLPEDKADTLVSIVEMLNTRSALFIRGFEQRLRRTLVEDAPKPRLRLVKVK